MSTELAKAFESAPTQQQAQQLWDAAKAFHAEPTDPGRPYSIVIPPPNVTAALHLGHALNNTLQDILVRWHRMLGDNTCWLPGTDHAGIATQTVVEKRVLAEEGKRRTDFAREEFVKKIQAWKDEYETRITGQLKAMGCSCDWDRQAFTMDDPRARAVREAFFQLFKDGLIYRGKRLVNWDPATQTALADDEVEMEEVDGHFYYLQYPLEDGSGHVTVATTRPETMLGDTAVAINPKDPRAAALRGKKVRLPIVDRVIPIIEDDYVVLPDPNSDDAKAKFATGFLKVTPAHDPNDYDLGRRHNLPMINVLAPDGTISDQHGWTDVGGADFTLGLDRYEAREAIVEWFRKNKLLEDVKPYRHSVGHSYRSHVAIEPYLSDQWYLSTTAKPFSCEEQGTIPGTTVTDRMSLAWQRANMGRSPAEQQAPQIDRGSLAGMALRALSPYGADPCAGADTAKWERQLAFYPDRYGRTFQAWHENIRDWCISRQLWWGHRIPVWAKVKIGNSPEERAWLHGPLYENLQRWKLEDRVAYRDTADPFSEATFVVCVRNEKDDEVIEGMERFGFFVRDPDVLDTWFSSALWPLSTLKWPDASALSNQHSALNTWNPSSVLCTAREIITLWVSRMVMFNLYFLKRLPFFDVFIHAMIQDGHGQKMSKSLGNGVDPMDIIASHGADAMRFALTQMATNTQDVRMPVDLVDPYTGDTVTPVWMKTPSGHIVMHPNQRSGGDANKPFWSPVGVSSGLSKGSPYPVAKNTSSKFDAGRNFCNKMWNAARFVIGMLEKAAEEDKGTRGQGDKETSALSTQHSALSSLSLSDRWILSRFTRALADAEEALKSYRFDQYAKASYDFFWGDLCDWYIEAAKPAVRDPARAAGTLQVLATVLDASLRLLHPAMPFITEVLFQKLNEVRPERGLAGMLELGERSEKREARSEKEQSAIGNRQSAMSGLLLRAPWPRSAFTDQSAEALFPRLQEIITIVRNLRNEYKLNPRKPLTVSISTSADHAQALLANRELIEVLGSCQIKAAGPNLAAPADSVRASAAGAELFVEGLVETSTGTLDPAERQRLLKDLDKYQKEKATLEGRLANPSYAQKAPPHLVQQTRDRLAQVIAEIEKIRKQLGE